MLITHPFPFDHHFILHHCNVSGWTSKSYYAQFEKKKNDLFDANLIFYLGLVFYLVTNNLSL
jgi:hypothetical protein